MFCTEVKVFWILTICVLAWSALCHGFEHTVTYLTLEGGQPYVPGSQYSGRVVIQLDHEGVNGSICSNSWRNSDARVVCKMLGFSIGRTASASLFANGNRNYLMGDLRCTGQEETVSKCPGAAKVISCVYGNKEVAVTCNGGPGNPVFGAPGLPFTTQTTASTTTAPPTAVYSICSGGHENIRLLSKEGTKSMGYVQVFIDEDWRFISDDSWSEKDAYVFCKELFCNGSTNICPRPAVQSEFLPDFYGPASVVWSEVLCNGNEKSIYDCARKELPISTISTNKKELAGVQCEKNPLDTEPTLEAVLDCKDPSGGLKIIFPAEAFPGLTEDNLNIFHKPSNSNLCNIHDLAHRNATEISLIIPHNTDCGTQRTENGTHICYENIVEYSHQVAWLVLTESLIKRFTIQCCISKESNVSIHFLPEPSVVTDSLTQPYDNQPEVNFCQDENCNAPISASPYSVAVGDWVYVGVHLKSEVTALFNDPHLKMAIVNCTLAFVGGLDMNESHGLIEEKCANDAASVTTYFISDTMESFRFRAFTVDGYSSAYVICQVRVCLSRDSNSSCDRSCGSPTPGRGRRQTANDVQIVEIVSGTLVFVDTDRDAGDALPAYSQEVVPKRAINPRFLKP